MSDLVGWHRVAARDATAVTVYEAKCVQCGTKENLYVYTWEMTHKPPHVLSNVSIMCVAHGQQLLARIVRKPGTTPPGSSTNQPMLKK